MPYSMPWIWSVGSGAPDMPLSSYLYPQKRPWPFGPCNNSCLEWMHYHIKRMHSCIVFSVRRISVPLISSSKLPPRFQLWLTPEKHSSTESSYFCLGDAPVRWYFWSWFRRRWIHDRDLYQVTHYLHESEMMDRFPYSADWTAVLSVPHSQRHPSPVTPSLRKS